MKSMKLYVSKFVTLAAFAICLPAVSLNAAKVEDYISNPPFSTSSVPPNVVVMLDNSGSMKDTMYGSTYDPDGINGTSPHYGIFDAYKNYAYIDDVSVNAEVAVDTSNYDGGDDDAYDVTLDETKVGAFVPDDTCTIGEGVNCWSGQFLNWLTTRRIDSARMVLVGGKIENRAGLDTDSDGEADTWKIVGNNEPEDRDLSKSYEDSSDVSPFPNASFTLTSPVKDGPVVTTGYDPYGKLQVTPGLAYLTVQQEETDATGNTVTTSVIIGEVGQTTTFDHNWETITFEKTYTDPIVVAGPLTQDGGDPAVIRIKDVTTDGCQIKVLEYEVQGGKDNGQSHMDERAYYMVVERGTHEIEDGPTLHAGEVEIAATSNPSSITFPAGTFAATPAVLATQVTEADERVLAVRMKDADSTGFDVGLQAQELDHPLVLPSTETVNYIAVQTGEFTDWADGTIVAGVESVTNSKDRADFTDSNGDPLDISGGLLLANLQTFDDTETASLRLTDQSIIVEEDTSLDDEQDHGAEDVGYLHITLDSNIEYNVAVLTYDKPEGLMHNVYNDVRLGVSFYNYDYQDKYGSIYTGYSGDGGTLRLKIPKNPFIDIPYVDDSGKKVGNSGFNSSQAEAKFRTIDTYVKGNPNDPTEADDHLLTIIDAIEHYPLVWGTTPLAENLVEVSNYFRQSTEMEYDDQVDYEPYQVSDEWDPYVINADTGEKIDCLDSFVLIFTDGYPYKDGCVPTTYIDYDEDENDEDARICDQFATGEEFAGSERDAEDNLDDVAKYVYENDLRTDIVDDDGNDVATENLTIYTVGFAGGTIRPILQQTADNAGGQAYAAEDGNTLSSVLESIFIKIQNQASSGTAAGVVSQSRSGVGAIYQALFYQQKDEAQWVGELQTLLIDDYGNLREDTIPESGSQDHKLTMETDKIVVFRDDGKADLYLDPLGVGFYTYDCEEETASPAFLTCGFEADTDCNGFIDSEEDACGSDSTCLEGLTECRDFDYCTECAVDIDDVDFLWKGSDWLNTIEDSNIQSQRSVDDFTKYSSENPNAKRYLFTFIDNDKDMLVDSGEQVAFTCPDGECLDGAVDKINDSDLLKNTAKIYPYLTLYSSLEGTGDATSKWSFDDQISALMAEEKEAVEADPLTTTLPFTEYLQIQTKRVIEFVRGEDLDKEDADSDGEYDLTVITGIDEDYSIPAFRKRTVDSNEWRLGDAIYSTPTMAAGPSEGYNLLYRDSTYSTFAARHQYRRGVVYLGTNDGIFHAFNAGFFREAYYDSDTGTYTYDKYWENCEVDETDGLICKDSSDYIDLGAELWGYIPYNLLPHLYWLTGADYDTTHVYYNDLKPRIFDAKIFEEETACTDSSKGRTHDECIHPYGWGTVLVGGMRLGGGEIRVDMDKADINSYGTYESDTDRTMASAYFILDITNPEAPPEVLAEFSFPGLGFTTCYPTAVPVRNEDVESEKRAEADADDTDSITFDETSEDYNKWYLVFGNGPNDLDTATSDTTGKLYVVDLNKLGLSSDERKLVTLRTDGLLTEYDASSPNEPLYAQELESNTFVSDPISVDYDLNFQADALYFGTVSGSEDDGWGGKLRRVLIENSDETVLAPSYWTLDSVLLDSTAVFDTDTDGTADVGQPITAAPSVALDTEDNRWIFWGTGRYFVEDDESNLDQQSYYGVKEPQNTDGDFTWGTVSRTDLFDVTGVWIQTDGTVTDTNSSVTNWDMLTDEIADKSGWVLDFSNGGERNLGQAALLGEVLTFTTYVPPDVISNPCLIDGESYLWALYYTTGSSYTNHIFGDGGDGGDPATISKNMSVGSGLTISPNLHVGRGDGSKAVLQTSTGAIKIEQQDTPGETKSGKSSWLERR